MKSTRVTTMVRLGPHPAGTAFELIPIKPEEAKTGDLVACLRERKGLVGVINDDGHPQTFIGNVSRREWITHRAKAIGLQGELRQAKSQPTGSQPS